MVGRRTSRHRASTHQGGSIRQIVFFNVMSNQIMGMHIIPNIYPSYLYKSSSHKYRHCNKNASTCSVNKYRHFFYYVSTTILKFAWHLSSMSWCIKPDADNSAWRTIMTILAVSLCVYPKAIYLLTLILALYTLLSSKCIHHNHFCSNTYDSSFL